MGFGGLGGYYQDRSPGPKKVPVGCKHVQQIYARSLPHGSGQWHCAACTAVCSPAIEQADRVWSFTSAEARRLDALHHLHTDEGFGTRFRHTPCIACVLPRLVIVYE